MEILGYFNEPERHNRQARLKRTVLKRILFDVGSKVSLKGDLNECD